MTARDELAEIASDEIGYECRHQGVPDESVPGHCPECWEIGGKVAGRILAADYRKPRTITTVAQLEALPFGSAVQTSDESDTVVLRCEGRNFRNQSGADLSVETLWRYGTHPFTVLYEPEPQP